MDQVPKPLWRRPIVLQLCAIGALVAVVSLMMWKYRRAQERERAAAVPPPVAAAGADTAFEFGRASLVPDTNVISVELVRSGTYVYSSSPELRNILFLHPGAKTGRWLLPDARHVIAERAAIEEQSAPNVKRVVAVVAIVKPFGEDLRVIEGSLVAFDPTGTVMEVLSERARTLHIARLGDEKSLLVMYERQRKFVVATVDRQTLKPRSEQVFDIPILK